MHISCLIWVSNGVKEYITSSFLKNAYIYLVKSSNILFLSSRLKNDKEKNVVLIDLFPFFETRISQNEECMSKINSETNALWRSNVEFTGDSEMNIHDGELSEINFVTCQQILRSHCSPELLISRKMKSSGYRIDYAISVQISQKVCHLSLCVNLL